MKALITAGCTAEKIDNVRSIVNISTGKLGSLIADAFSASEDIEKIYYVCNNTAVLPQSKKADIIYIDSVASLENTLKGIFSQDRIDIIIHSMAVSDYRVKAIYSGPEKINIDKKISSDIDDLVLFMEKTPKIISMFQKISPQSVLVGFKLLDSVSQETLIDTGLKLLQENKCDFVLANDLAQIKDGNHIGLLINPSSSYQCFYTKQEIARGIAESVLSKIGGVK